MVNKKLNKVKTCVVIIQASATIYTLIIKVISWYDSSYEIKYNSEVSWSKGRVSGTWGEKQENKVQFVNHVAG